MNTPSIKYHVVVDDYTSIQTTEFHSWVPVSGYLQGLGLPPEQCLQAAEKLMQMGGDSQWTTTVELTSMRTRGHLNRKISVVRGPAPKSYDHHTLYEDSDADRPEQICDRNGQVVLGLCKVCGKGEAQLIGPCVPKAGPDANIPPVEAFGNRPDLRKRSLVNQPERYELCVGRVLHTKDGSKIGNAVITAITPNEKFGKLYAVRTDFGNWAKNMNAEEVLSLFCISDRIDDPGARMQDQLQLLDAVPRSHTTVTAQGPNAAELVKIVEKTAEEFINRIPFTQQAALDRQQRLVEQMNDMRMKVEHALNTAIVALEIDPVMPDFNQHAYAHIVALPRLRATMRELGLQPTDYAGKYTAEDFREAIGQALNQALTDPTAAPEPDWHDSREVDRLIDAIITKLGELK